MFWTIIIFILVLSLLVFVHELGHFLVAKKMGMKVEEFGFGFPPRAWGVKKGETIYSINWLPLGGFVRIKGESGEHREDPDSFASKKAWRRFLVLVAGVTMNLILAAVLFSVGFMAGLPSVIDDQTPASAVIEDSAMRVIEVVKDSPADKAGITSQDKLISIDDQVFDTANDARAYLSEFAEGGVSVVVQRPDDTFFETEVTSEVIPEYGDQKVIGIGLVRTGLVKLPVHLAIFEGVKATGAFTVEIVRAFATLIKNLVTTGKVSVALSGPVGIAVLTGEVAAQGFVHLMQFTAILSINLAIINILPFPALDGGRVLFLIIEKLRGKPVNQRLEAIVHNLGFALLMLLVILVTYRDIVSFGDEIIGALKSAVGA